MEEGRRKAVDRLPRDLSGLPEPNIEPTDLERAKYAKLEVA